jgi:hypothetical protein
MLPQLPRLIDYDISPQNGFLPSITPLETLPDSYYEPWETVVRNFQSLILSKRLRQVVNALPVLSTDLLLNEAEWQRAHSILAFIAHAYVWGGDTPCDVSLFYPRTPDPKHANAQSRRCHRQYPSLSLRHVSTSNYRLLQHTQRWCCGTGGQSSIGSRLMR